MNDTAYADVILSGDLNHVTTAQLAAIDLLASLLTGPTGWRLTLEIDPGTVITATPPRDGVPPEQPSEAPLSDERDPSAHAEAPNPGNGPTA